MVEQDDLSAQSKTRSYISLLLRALLAIIVTFFFLTSVRIIGKSFDLANEVNPSLVKGLFERAGNPLVGVLVGVLVTSLLQSSSATTSMLVVLVAAATDPMRLDVAIPNPDGEPKRAPG